VLLLASVPLPGCGGDGSEQSAKGESPTTAKAGETLTLVATEYSFSPAKAKVLGAGDVTLELDNRGRVSHNLTVRRGKAELTAVPTIGSKEIKSGTLSLPPGRYQLICTINGHEKLGMRATLEVRG
jgi:plastocyanin